MRKNKVNLLNKINDVQKHKGVMTPCELLGENGKKLKNCGGMAEEKSILKQKKVTTSKKVPSKGSKKSWEDYIRWLRNKKVMTVKDFDSDCEQKWLISAESEKLHMKVNEEKHKVYKKADEKQTRFV